MRSKDMNSSNIVLNIVLNIQRITRTSTSLLLILELLGPKIL